MFSRDSLLAQHKWTQNSLDILFDHCAGFSDEQLQQEHAGFGFPSLYSQLAHILQCENYWLWNLTGRPAVSDADLQEAGTFAGLVALRPAINAATRAFIESASEEMLNTERVFEGDDNELPVTCSPAYVILHVLTHAYHHKGQAVAQCRLLGRPVPDTDMVRWILRDGSGK